jgi:hypothetical protein
MIIIRHITSRVMNGTHFWTRRQFRFPGKSRGRGCCKRHESFEELAAVDIIVSIVGLGCCMLFQSFIYCFIVYTLSGFLTSACCDGGVFNKMVNYWLLPSARVLEGKTHRIS